MFIGLWPAAGFFPPHEPTATAAEIAAIYQANPNGIRLGTVLFLFAAALFLPMVAAISAQMRRIESQGTPVLTYIQLGAGIAATLFFVIPAMFWTVAAFRPDRDPEITQLFNDMGWMFFVMPFTLPFVQNLAIGFAALTDTSPRRVYPRWLGYFNLWSAVLFIPGGLLTFFKTGPFAWDGLLAFWIPAIVFSLWMNIMAVYTIFAARDQARGAGATA